MSTDPAWVNKVHYEAYLRKDAELKRSKRELQGQVELLDRQRRYLKDTLASIKKLSQQALDESVPPTVFDLEAYVRVYRRALLNIEDMAKRNLERS